MPTTQHGRTTLESAWRAIVQGQTTGDEVQRTIALALVSIALSLRKIAATVGTNTLVRH